MHDTSDQVDALEGRDVVVVRNAFVKMVGGFMKLEYNDWGKVSPICDRSSIYRLCSSLPG